MGRLLVALALLSSLAFAQQESVEQKHGRAEGAHTYFADWNTMPGNSMVVRVVGKFDCSQRPDIKTTFELKKKVWYSVPVPFQEPCGLTADGKTIARYEYNHLLSDWNFISVEFNAYGPGQRYDLFFEQFGTPFLELGY